MAAVQLALLFLLLVRSALAFVSYQHTGLHAPGQRFQLDEERIDPLTGAWSHLKYDVVIVSPRKPTHET